MKKAFHIKMAGESTGVIVIPDPGKEARVKSVLNNIRFGDLPAFDTYFKQITDALFDLATVLEPEDLEIH